MKDNFRACLATILLPNIEGGYVNNPHDPGGSTNHGVTQHTLDIFRINHGLPHEDVRQMSAAEIAEIYESGYWKPARCDQYSVGLDLVVFNACVMSGLGTANTLLLHTPHTIDDMLNAHLHFLRHLTTWGYFGHGWTNRIDFIRKAAHAMVAKRAAEEAEAAKAAEAKAAEAAKEGDDK